MKPDKFNKFLNNSFNCIIIALTLCVFPGKKVYADSLSLNEYLETVMAENPSIRTAIIDIKNAREDIAVAAAGYDLMSNARYAFAQSQTPAASFLEGGGNPEVHEKKHDWMLGVNAPHYFGGDIGIIWESSRFESDSKNQLINPVNKSNISLTANQPLLRNAWATETNTRIYISKRNFEIIKEQKIDQINDILLIAIERYWKLCSTLYETEVKKRTYEQALAIRDKVQADVEQGKRSMVDGYKAEAALASREGELSRAETALMQAMANVQLTMGRKANLNSIVPSSYPDSIEFLWDNYFSVDSALSGFAAIKILEQEKEILKTQIKAAKNGFLPKLDLQGKFNLKGIGTDYSASVDQIADSDYRDWNLSLNLGFPLQNRKARSEHSKLEYNKKKIDLLLNQTRQHIHNQITIQHQTLKTSWLWLNSCKNVKKFREADADAALEKLNLGMITIEDILEAQKKENEAQIQFFHALSEYNMANAVLHKSKGDLIEYLGLDPQDLSLSPGTEGRGK